MCHAKTQSTITTPDFAYPQTVNKHASAQLAAALKQHNDPQTLRALMDIALAKTAIDADSMPTVINMVSKIRSKLSSPTAKSLAYLLEATILDELYQNNKYAYDRRVLPLYPLAEDLSEWSGEQFRHTIDSLTNLALVEPSLKTTPIFDYKTVLTIDSLNATFYPTLFDFVGHHAISLKSNLSEYSSLPICLLSPRFVIYGQSDMPLNDGVASDILDIYRQLVELHINDYAPLIYCELKKINFIKDNIVYDDDINNKTNTLLLDLYDRYKEKSTYSSMLLIAMNAEQKNSKLDTKQYYELLKQNLSRYPDYFQNGCLQNIIARLTQPVLSYNTRNTLCKGDSIGVKLTVCNVNNLTIKVYRVDNSEDDNIQLSKLKTQYRSRSVSIAGNVPFETDTTINIPIDDYGLYAISCETPSIKVSKNQSIPIFTCTDITYTSISNGETELVAVNPLSGAPVDNATVKRQIYSGSKLVSTTNVGHTSAQGIYTFTKDQKREYRRIALTKGQDKYGFEFNINVPGLDDDLVSDTLTGINGYTDRAIYHPGDTVRWVAVAYQSQGRNSAPIAKKALHVKLYNANNVVVADTSMTTDAFGRINGSNKIPAGELTGQYTISINDFTDKLRQRFVSGNIRFMVSDYKVPTFNITIDEPYRDVPQKGDISIVGTLTTYSGVPVQNASVNMVLKRSVRSWWSTNYIPIYSAAATTDASGRFEIAIDGSSLGEDNKVYIYNVEIDATSMSGESQNASKQFTLSPGYVITATMPLNNNLDDGKPQLKIIVIDGKDREADARVKIQFMAQDGVEKYQTITSSSTPTINWDSIPSGEYNIKISTVEHEAEPFTSLGIVLYRTSDKTIPVDEILWSPQENGSITTFGNNANLTYGVLHSDMYLLVTIFDPMKSAILKQEWLRPQTGIQQMSITLPDGCDQLNVMLSTNYQYKSKSIELVVKRSNDNELKIVRESFRDRLIPGNLETWKFRTATGSNQWPTSAAFIVDMYDAALDALMPYNFTFSLAKPYMPQLGLYSYDPRQNYFKISQSISYYKCLEIPVLDFNTYNRNFVELRYLRNFGAQKLMSTTAMGIAYAKAPMAQNEDTAEEVECELMADDNVEADSGSIEGASIRNNTADKNIYRSTDTPVALWRPMLTTDSLGNIEVSFTVPNANTTWRLNMLAYTASMNYAIDRMEILANKPIMVQPNLPRFLRTGDKATVLSTVFNNTDSQRTVSILCEVFNPLSGDIITSNSYSKTIPANASDTVASIINAPSDISMIAYRIKATNDNFTDGEQSFIPILPSSQPVVESRTFYLNEVDTIAEIKLPAMSPDARVTLQYCDNPIWYLVTALPGLAENNPITAPQAADAIFSAAAAQALLKQYPQITEALEYWSKSDKSDNTLRSMLEKNEDLKVLLLQSTPWVADAHSDTQRMQRLSLLLDSHQTEKNVNIAIATLSKLMRDNNGWAWMNQCDLPSSWATYYTLHTLGRLNELGYLPADKSLKSMTSSALKWYLGEMDKAYLKNRDDYSSAYVTLCDMWPNHNPSATGKEIISKSVADIAANWKKSAIWNLPSDVQTLAKHSRIDTARDILASLRQYAMNTPQYGMWWPKIGEAMGGSMSQLDVTADAMRAFHTIEPQGIETNAIAQWLILQKEARNWGNSATATNIIYSLLTSTPQWIKSATVPQINVNGQPMPFTVTDSLLGSFKSPLPIAVDQPVDITILRSGATPAWGAVYTQYTAAMEQVKAEKCDAVSIEKLTFILKGDKWVKATDFKAGDRVRVQLTIKANRNIQYVTIDDNRAACFEPTEQLPKPIYSEGICFYRENLDSATRMFVTNMPKGTYLLTYELWVNNAGEFASGIATIQSQYAPQITAHSSGRKIKTQ